MKNRRKISTENQERIAVIIALPYPSDLPLYRTTQKANQATPHPHRSASHVQE
jgi:hypothetical protein